MKIGRNGRDARDRTDIGVSEDELDEGSVEGVDVDTPSWLQDEVGGRSVPREESVEMEEKNKIAHTWYTQQQPFHFLVSKHQI